jgi:hypothetical protein
MMGFFMGYKNYTDEQILELKSCYDDISYFTNLLNRHAATNNTAFSFIHDLYGNKTIVNYLNDDKDNFEFSMCAYILWFSLFNSYKTTFLICRDMTIARDRLNIIRKMHENLPAHIKCDLTYNNKHYMEFDNNASIMLASAKSSCRVRGHSISLLWCDDCINADEEIGKQSIILDTFPAMTCPLSSIVLSSSKNDKLQIENFKNIVVDRKCL